MKLQTACNLVSSALFTVTPVKSLLIWIRTSFLTWTPKIGKKRLAKSRKIKRNLLKLKEWILPIACESWRNLWTLLTTILQKSDFLQHLKVISHSLTLKFKLTTQVSIENYGFHLSNKKPLNGSLINLIWK